MVMSKTTALDSCRDRKKHERKQVSDEKSASSSGGELCEDILHEVLF